MFLSYNLKDLICRGALTLEVVDDLVLYKAELMSSIGNIFRNNDLSTDITVVVYKGLDDITHKFTDIEWKRFTFDSNGEDDKTWGEKHKGKKTITVTREEILGKAVIQCGVYQNISGERELVAAQSITFIDVNDMTPSTTPPDNPKDGEIWIDSSVDPPIINIWDEEKGQWRPITTVGSSTKNLINNSNFWKGYDFTDFTLTGKLNDYRIAPYQGKNYAQLRADTYDEEIRGFYQDIKKSYFPDETYILQANAYLLDFTGMYDGGITLKVVDVTTKQGPNLEEIEVEKELASETFKLKNNKIDHIYTSFVMPTKITKLRVYVYGEIGTAFHIAVTELSLSHNNKPHDWEMSDDDLQWKIDNKVSNDPKDVFNALTDNGKMQGIYTAINPETGNDDYYINANYIKSGQVEADYINAKGLTVSKEILQEDGTNKTVNTLEVTKDGDVHILANKLSIMPYAETNIPTKDEVNKELETKVNADKESIITAINDTGIFMENGKLTINADNVSTGILKSRNDMTNFNLNEGTFRLGKNDNNFKLKFDGTDLLFGQGAIKWENLDTSITEELIPYDVYLEKTFVIVGDEVNNTEVSQGENGQLIIPDEKPINKVLAVKGNDKLTPVNATPKEGEFSFRILEQNGCEAIKHTKDSFYINKVDVENAYVKVSISCEDKQILTRTMTITNKNIEGKPGPAGPPGPGGDLATFVYCKSNEKPAKPVGNKPEGWYERIEEIIEQGDLWCSQGIKDANTGDIKDEWQEPYKLEDANNNLLSNYTWTPGTGDCGIYKALGGSTENIRTTDKDPKGNQNILWTTINQDGNTGILEYYDGGFSASVKIDYMKTYRFSVWAKVSDKDCYINMTADPENTEDKGGSAQPNPSFFSSPLPETDKWYLIVGYVLGTGIPHNPTNSGVYDSLNGDRIVINGKEQTLPIFKNKDGATKQTIKVFMSGSETIGATAKFFDPRIEIIDGEEQSLDSILGKISNMKWIYEWNGTKTEINGNSVLTPKLFTGTIDEITGKHTGVAMGMDVLGDGQNGIVGYSKGDKTFHIKTDGSAVFGKEDKDHIEISSDGIATIPIVKGDRIQANKLVVYYTDSKGEQILNPNTKQPIKTLEVTDRGEVILHPSKFEMLSGIIEGGGSGGDSEANALVPQLQELGMIFDMSGPKPKFEINATQITAGKIAADRLDLYGLIVHKKGFDGNETSTKTFEVTETGDVNINAQTFRLCTTNSNGDLINGENINDMVSGIVMSQDTIDMIAGKINIKGMVTFEDLNNALTTTDPDGDYVGSDGEWHRTEINGGNIKTGTVTLDALSSNNSSKPIIRLFDNCALDATANMNQGKGQSIRLKWDDSNYIRIDANGTMIYTNAQSTLSLSSRDGNLVSFFGGAASIDTAKSTARFRQSNENYISIGGTAEAQFRVWIGGTTVFKVTPSGPASVISANLYELPAPLTKDARTDFNDFVYDELGDTISMYSNNKLEINAYKIKSSGIGDLILDEEPGSYSLNGVISVLIKALQEEIGLRRLLEDRVTELETKLTEVK